LQFLSQGDNADAQSQFAASDSETLSLLLLRSLLIAAYIAVVPPAGGQVHPSATETIVVPGLQKPVELLIDRWGVPHVYAKNEVDLFFAQGF